MRPVRLVLEGFTSYRHREAVDFSGLDLFAITGPTGAGKSSLVDAISYALYGRAPRIDDRGRAVRQLISQGCSRMRVVLEFESGGRRYRIARSTSALPSGRAEVQLEVYSPDRGAWEPLADRAAEVEALVRRVVGMDYDAFARSVVLPQGRFQRFLLGGREEQDRVLEDLLGLDRYREAMRRANEAAARHAARAEEAERRLASELAEATPERLREVKLRLLELRGAAARAEHQAALADRLLPSAHRLARLREDLSREEEVMGKVGPEAQGAAAEADRLARIEQDLQGQLQEVEHEIVALAFSPEAYASAALAARAARDLEELRRRLQELDDAIAAAAREAEERRQALDRARQEAEAAERAAEEAASRRDGAHIAASEATGRLERARELEEAIAAAARQMEEAARREGDQRGRLEEAERRAASARERLEEAAEALRAARKRLEECHVAHAAHLLRARLVPGDPCPVCRRPVEEAPPAGDAPALAAAEEAVALAEGELEAARVEEREAATEASAAQEALAAAAGAREEAARRRDDLVRALAELAGLPGASPADALAQLQQEAKRLQQEASLAEGTLREAQRARRQAEERLRQATKAEAAASQLLQGLEERRQQAQEQAAALERDLGGADRAALEERLGRLEKAKARHDELSRRRDELRQQLDETRSRLAAQRERAGQLRERLEEAARRAQELEQAAQETAAALLQELEAEGWEAEAAAIRSGGDAAPLLERRRRDAQGELPTLDREIGRLQEQERRLDGDIRLAQELRRQMEQDRRRAEVAAQLASLLRADRLQAFVREEALAALAAEASERLRQLSRGRYSLAAAGDGFAVVDHWNGAEARPAGTLSGGETFLASLALALAMAEALPAFMDGARAGALESIFIDEGFSHLDEETLDIVAGALEELAVGDRMVGVITHISALADRLPARLRVVRDGGQARVVREE